ncbi:MAG: D-alanyl-D-alanine carboxypeptidase [Chitinophagaceae bacterium]|nr:D-alanyl-D-alanine carboxypeptidase [Chitinophagaceae bacterium]
MKYDFKHAALPNIKMLKNYFILLLAGSVFLFSCTVSKQIAKQANATILKDSAVNTGHIGISIYEPATNKYWYNHNAINYFIPASNTKLFTLYAGMKYLGDSLVGARYFEKENALIIIPTADPTFLNEEYKFQPLLAAMHQSTKPIVIRFGNEAFSRWGNGWAWNDYQNSYMVEKSEMPIFGNTITFFDVDDSALAVFGTENFVQFHTQPKLFANEKYWNKWQFKPYEVIKENNWDSIQKRIALRKSFFFKIGRNLESNTFYIRDALEKQKQQQIPFATSRKIVVELLSDTIKKPIYNAQKFMSDHENLNAKFSKTIHSQPSDSLFKPMMHRSDNFFAEQTLLMASNEFLGFMSDEKMIDTILKSSLKDLPQRPKWVDGSGLSRYNLTTPQSLVYLLNKMKNEFGLERLKTILPTGGEGTLASYFKKNAGRIYAKTGTLSNNCALSGFLITQKGKLLVFSILNNNYITGAAPIRKAAEQFLENLINTY